MKSARWLVGMLAAAMTVAIAMADRTAAAAPDTDSRVTARPALFMPVTPASAPICTAPPLLLTMAAGAAQVPFCEDICTPETPCDTSCRVVGITTCRVWGNCDYWGTSSHAKDAARAKDAKAVVADDAGAGGALRAAPAVAPCPVPAPAFAPTPAPTPAAR